MIEFIIKTPPEISGDIANRVMAEWPGTEAEITDRDITFRLSIDETVDQKLLRLEELFQKVESIRGIDSLDIQTRCLSGPDSSVENIRHGRFIIQDINCDDIIETPVMEDGRIILTIESGPVFGSGAHPSTMLALTAVEEYFNPGPGIPLRDGTRVLDVGTGTGILALAAANFVNTPVLGVDISEEAVKAAETNAVLNNLQGKVIFKTESADGLQGEYDLILANLVTSVMIRTGRKIARLLAPEGLMIVSGFADSQAPQVVKALTKAGLVSMKSYSQNGWTALMMIRN